MECPGVRSTGRRVAVVGSGPAGISAAAELAMRGHQVTILETRAHAGGLLWYGIPEFRLPARVVEREIDRLRALGVRIITGVEMGTVPRLHDRLAEGHEAVFLAVGGGQPRWKELPGERLPGVYSAADYLARAGLRPGSLPPQEQGPAVRRGKRVIVLGGGDSALDAARTALRLGANASTVIYRRSRAEMSACASEIREGLAEGVALHFHEDALELLGSEDNGVEGVRCTRLNPHMDDEGRPELPRPIPGSEFMLPADVVVGALGFVPADFSREVASGIQLDAHGAILADEASGKTSLRGVWAGGDDVRGPATVVLAVRDGRRAARSIHEFLSTGVW